MIPIPISPSTHGRAPRRFVDYKLDRQSSVALDPSNLAHLCCAMHCPAFAGQLFDDIYNIIYSYIYIYSVVFICFYILLNVVL